MRRFNTAGPCRIQYDYMVPALSRLPEAPPLVNKMGYFVVHAPRQTGKTTALRALSEELTAAGSHAALHFSCEIGEAAGDDYAAAQHGVLQEIRSRAADALPAELRPPRWPDVPDANLLKEALAAWARVCPRPLVLFFDEIDALRGQSLISVLRQLRAGFSERPKGFPASVALCGLRDVREYKAAAGGDPLTEPITAGHLEQAKERLVLARATHLDSLAARLAEPRVRHVVEPVIAGTLFTGDAYDDDVQYARDLGLVAATRPVRIANPIYREVVARVLSASVEENVVADPRSFVLADGRLDFTKLLYEFAAFWREHGEILTSGQQYHEVAPPSSSSWASCSAS